MAIFAHHLATLVLDCANIDVAGNFSVTFQFSMMPSTINDCAVSFCQSSRAALLMLLIRSVEKGTILVSKQSLSVEVVLSELALVTVPT